MKIEQRPLQLVSYYAELGTNSSVWVMPTYACVTYPVVVLGGWDGYLYQE